MDKYPCAACRHIYYREEMVEVPYVVKGIKILSNAFQLFCVNCNYLRVLKEKQQAEKLIRPNNDKKSNTTCVTN